MAMDPKLKREWVKALRSGKYEQTQGALCKWIGVGPDGKGRFGFCCLGVAADIGLDGEWEKIRGRNEYRVVVRGNGMDGLLGKTFGDPLGIPPKKQRQLAELNDGGYSFAKIADAIENDPTL